jgi:hypothetical protein
LQNWHLYRFSFSLSVAVPGARRADGDVLFCMAPATAAMVESLTISLAGDKTSAISNELMLDAEGGAGAGGLHYFAPRRLSTAKLGKSGRG